MAYYDVDPLAILAKPFKPVFEDVLEEKHAEYWLKGGRGSTKSSFTSVVIIVGMLMDPLANAIVYRMVANTIKDSVYAQIVWAINEMGLGKWFRFKQSPLEIIYMPTGQRVIFRGADDPMKSKSIKLAHGYFKYLWFEELAEFRSMEDVRVIKQSIIRGADKAFTFYSYNPPRTQANWTNGEALAVRKDRLVHHSSYLDVPKEWLGEAFIVEAEALRDANERAYRHAYLGEITGTGGQVFDNLALRGITDEEIQTFDRVLNGLDFGFAVDPCALVKAFYDRRNHRLFLFDEFYEVRTPNERLAEVCLSKCGRGTIFCDSADPRTINELKGRGVTAVGVMKGPDSVRHGMNWLQDLREIVIDPARCPNAAREFAGYEYAQDRYGGFRADFPDVNNHAIDAARYAVSEAALFRPRGSLI